MELTNGHYQIDGVSVSSLCEEFGTPIFVYETAKMKQQYERMKQAFDVKNLKINYAMKALSNLSVLKFFKKLGSGLDTVSVQEVELGVKAGFDPSDIVYTPNMVGTEEFEKAVDLGVKVNIDNLEMLEYFGHHHENHPVCIRINPHIMAGGNSNISVGHIDSKFGISIHQMPLVLRLVDTLNINVEGIHMHTGSDILEPQVFLQAAEILFDVAKKFDRIEYLDFGSGFKVKYKPDDIETDIEAFGKQMSKRFNEFCQETGKDLTLMFEPGKFLVSEAGYFFAKANVIKQTTSSIFAGVDSGFNHLIRPMFYNAYHHIENISNPKGQPRIYTVVGYICETDTLGWNRRIAEIKRDDILGFRNAGAYCFAMASNYNSRYRPAEVLIHGGEAHLIRKRETLEDLERGQQEVAF